MPPFFFSPELFHKDFNGNSISCSGTTIGSHVNLEKRKVDFKLHHSQTDHKREEGIGEGRRRWRRSPLKWYTLMSNSRQYTIFLFFLYQLQQFEEWENCCILLISKSSWNDLHQFVSLLLYSCNPHLYLYDCVKWHLQV